MAIAHPARRTRNLKTGTTQAEIITCRRHRYTSKAGERSMKKDQHKKYNKYIFAVLIGIFMAASLASCGDGDSTPPPAADFSSGVGGF
jgi:hypothetical protein